MHKNPLRPAIIFGIVCFELFFPRKAVSNCLELFIKSFFGNFRLFHWMRSDFKRVVFRMDAKPVKPDRLENIASPHSIETAVNVRTDKRIHIPDVKPLRRRIREHHEVIKGVFRLF